MFYTLYLYHKNAYETIDFGIYYTIEEGLLAIKAKYPSWTELHKTYLGDDVLITGLIDEKLWTAVFDAFM